MKSKTSVKKNDKPNANNVNESTTSKSVEIKKIVFKKLKTKKYILFSLIILLFVSVTFYLDINSNYKIQQKILDAVKIIVEPQKFSETNLLIENKKSYTISSDLYAKKENKLVIQNLEDFLFDWQIIINNTEKNIEIYKNNRMEHSLLPFKEINDEEILLYNKRLLEKLKNKEYTTNYIDKSTLILRFKSNNIKELINLDLKNISNNLIEKLQKQEEIIVTNIQENTYFLELTINLEENILPIKETKLYTQQENLILIKIENNDIEKNISIKNFEIISKYNLV